MKFSSNAKDFFRRLEKALDNARISKGDLAKTLGVALSTVSRWRTAMPRTETLHQISAILGVSTAWLLGADDQEDVSTPVTKAPNQTALPVVAGGNLLLQFLGDAIRTSIERIGKPNQRESLSAALMLHELITKTEPSPWKLDPPEFSGLNEPATPYMTRH